ncbi:MAG: hypothetical protein ACOVSI_11240 [Gemmatimonas sp.]|jgi:hypothetical protein
MPATYLSVIAGSASHGHAHGDAMDDSSTAPDGLAVIDVDSGSRRYTEVVAYVPSGTRGGMPHYTEMIMPPGGGCSSPPTRTRPTLRF